MAATSAFAQRVAAHATADAPDPYTGLLTAARERLAGQFSLEALRAPTASVEPSRLNSGQQMALFPEASPMLKELEALDVSSMTPLEAINKLYEWQRRYTAGRE